MKEITVLTMNRVGALADVAEALGNNGINIDSISAQSFKDMGVIRIITSDEKSAMHALMKMAAVKEGFEIKLGDVIIVSIPDKPGELAKIAKKIARAGINIECIYQLKRDHEVQVVIKPEKLEDAVSTLKKNGVNVKV
ncbi:MAG: ACT domain-containing protein [Candidatus Micrarchaeia archaeon]